MPKLNLVAPVGHTGYGVTGFNILKIMLERDWEVSLFPRGESQRSSQEDSIIRMASERSKYFDYDAPCINLWHQFDLSIRIGKGKYLGWPIFELNTFDEREIHNLCYPDELIVCSKWAKEIVSAIYNYKYDGDVSPLHNKDWWKSELDKKIHVVPLGIDHSIFNTRNVPERNRKNTVFLNVGKWEIRKGHDFLGEIFNRAFTPEDNVELWLCPYNPFLSETEHKQWVDLYMQTPLGQAGKIKISPWLPNHEAVAGLMAKADCGVFPSRAEGWNLELMEMMALGKPVIATDYSGHTEFCNSDNCLLIDINDVEPAFDGRWFFDQGDWAEIHQEQEDQLVEHMQYVHSCCQQPGKFINDAGIMTARNFTWDNTVDLLEKILDN